MVGGQQRIPVLRQCGAGGVHLCIGGVACHHGVGAGFVDDPGGREFFVLRVLDVAQTEQDLFLFAGGKGDVDVQRTHRCPAVGDAAAAVPGADSLRVGGPPYTPQKASRVVSKLVTGVLDQNMA